MHSLLLAGSLLVTAAVSFPIHAARAAASPSCAALSAQDTHRTGGKADFEAALKTRAAEFGPPTAISAARRDGAVTATWRRPDNTVWTLRYNPGDAGGGTVSSFVESDACRVEAAVRSAGTRPPRPAPRPAYEVEADEASMVALERQNVVLFRFGSTVGEGREAAPRTGFAWQGRLPVDGVEEDTYVMKAPDRFMWTIYLTYCGGRLVALSLLAAGSRAEFEETTAYLSRTLGHPKMTSGTDRFNSPEDVASWRLADGNVEALRYNDGGMGNPDGTRFIIKVVSKTGDNFCSERR